MKVLIVCSGNSRFKNFDFKSQKPFIYEQIESLSKYNVEYATFFREYRNF